jgi:tricarballylate dehydrogenase
MQLYDVIVVGKGNAALWAALAARDRGVSGAMLEAASSDESGGSSRFAGGLMRFACDNAEDLRKLIDVTHEEARNTDWGSNTRDPFFGDPYRVINFRTDLELSEILVTS